MTNGLRTVACERHLGHDVLARSRSVDTLKAAENSYMGIGADASLRVDTRVPIITVIAQTGAALSRRP